MEVCGEWKETTFTASRDIKEDNRMELMIYSPDENERLPEVQWNFEEIKRYAAEKAAWYQSIAYTDADTKEMKSDKAEINKFINALEDARKQKKKEYMAPYEVFEGQVKEALLPLRKTVALITEKIDEVEEQCREARKAKMEEFYYKYVGDLQPMVPFQKTIKEEFYKRAFTDKKLEQAYGCFFERLREDIKGLDQLPEKFRDKALLKYMEEFSLSAALQEGKRLEELDRLMEERRRKQEEERQARMAEESRRLEAAAREAQKQQELAAKQEPVQKEEPKAEMPQAPQAPQKPQEEILHMDFRVWGTREQIMGLRQYLINNQIKFGKVE